MKSRSRLIASCLAAACLAGALGATGAQAAEVPAWAPIAASGPTNLPPIQNEVQRVAVDAEGGTYTLAQKIAEGSGTLNVSECFCSYGNASTQVIVEFPLSGTFAVGQRISGPGIQAGTTITAVSGSILTISAPTTAGGAFSILTASSKVVTGVTASSGSFAVGQTISGAGIPSGTTITSLGAGTLTLSGFPTQGGTKALTAAATTAPIDFDAEASEVEASLIAAGLAVNVTGGRGGKGATTPYSVAFVGGSAGTNVPQLSANSGALTGGDNHTATVTTAVDGGPGTTTIAIYVQNVGGASASGTTTLTFTLPPGVTTTDTPSSGSIGAAPDWICGFDGTVGAGQSTGKCTSSIAMEPGFTFSPVNVPVIAGPSAADGAVHIEVSGGGTVGTKTYDMPLLVSAIPAPPGLQAFTAGAYTDDGAIDTRAGAHPYSASAGILVNSVRSPTSGAVVPAGEFRDIVVDTPPGFLGNPISAVQCPESLPAEACEQSSIVATAQIPLGFGSRGEQSSVNNIEAPFGYPAKFRFRTGLNEVTINVPASLRSDEDYGLETGSYDTPQIKTVFGSFFTFWGKPYAASHDGQRCREWRQLGSIVAFECVTREKILAAGKSDVAFLTNPVDCAEEAIRQPKAVINVNTWQNPGLWFTNDVALKPIEECDKLKFQADFKFEPSDTKSDSPASFRSELTVPSEGLTNPDKLMTPTIRETVVSLPKGVALNASAADGLGACSKEQIGLMGTNFPNPNKIRFSKAPQTCPDSSKIGSGEVKSELIEEPLKGALYLAAQGNGNPFGSLFAIYLVIEDPRHGIFVKLPGEVQVDKSDGQQKVVFRDLPPLPFSYLRLTLKGGSRSPLVSPTTCGNYVTDAINTPWSYPESGPPTTSSNGFEINQGPNGLPCAPTPQARPFDIGLKAGTAGTAAGQFSPLTFQITRPDGSQELNTLELSTAPGLSAKLKGIPQCSDAAIASASSKTGRQEQASSSCPGASQIGKVITGAGSGPTPFYSEGKLYLSGPYKGAPLSVVAITPAVAGPFDLGNVVVRTAVFINRSTAQVTAKSDPIPQILEGVPLRIKDVRVILEKQNFSLNPTSCDQTAISAHITGNSGASKDLSSRFQVGGCESLDFKPSFSAMVKGGTKRGSHPQFIADVSWPEGSYANTKDFQVTLPHSEFLDQAHIRTICTRVQALADACPPGSIYGFAEAETPLLDGKLTGPVFLKSSDHKLPDLAIKLKGPDSMPVEVEFAGRIDSIHGQIRNTIEGLPDVPVSHFTLRMAGGKKGLLINSRNLCTTRKVRLDVNATAQNNKPIHLRPVLRNSCKEARKAKRHHRRGKR